MAEGSARWTSNSEVQLNVSCLLYYRDGFVSRNPQITTVVIRAKTPSKERVIQKVPTYFAHSTFYTELITTLCAYYVVSICFSFL